MYWLNYVHVFKLSKRTEEQKTKQKEDQMTMSKTCHNVE